MGQTSDTAASGRPLLGTGQRTPAWAGAVGLLLIAGALWVSKLESLDLTVYRAGSLKFLQDPAQLYAGSLTLEHGNELPFTYPPFAALIMVPLAVVPYWLAVAMNTALSVGLLYFVCRDLGPRLAAVLPASWAPATLPVILTGIACWLGPFRDSFVLGQINVLIFSAIYLACVRWGLGFWAGVLIGLAGGVKLTPLALGLVPLAQNRWKMIGGICAGFFGSVGLMWGISPALSGQYWLHVLRDPSRVGGLGYFDNISFRGTIERLGVHSGGLWFLVSLGVIAVAFLALRALRLHLDTPAALGVVSFAMLVISPVSWSHHGTWMPTYLYALLLVGQRTGRFRRTLLGVGLVLLLLLGSGFRLVGIDFEHTHPEILVSLWWRLLVSLPDALMMLALGVLLAAGLRAADRPPLFASLDALGLDRFQRRWTKESRSARRATGSGSSASGKQGLGQSEDPA